jgi:hypothetical protein
MSLATCPECRRHVKVTETACPFCNVTLPSDMAARVQHRPPNRSRFGRAALVSFSAVVATSAVACGSDEDDTGSDQNGQHGGGAGGEAADGGPGGAASTGGSSVGGTAGASVGGSGGQIAQPVYGIPIDYPDANIGQPEYGVPIDVDASTPGAGGSAQPVYGIAIDPTEP